MMQERLALRLRVLRAERRVTLREVEAETGVAKETLSDLERGLRRPKDVTLAKLADFYGVGVGELLELEEPVPLALAEARPQAGHADLPRRPEDAPVTTRWRVVGGELRPVMFWNIPPEEREPYRARFRKHFPEGFEEEELTSELVAELASSAS